MNKKICTAIALAMLMVPSVSMANGWGGHGGDPVEDLTQNAEIGQTQLESDDDRNSLQGINVVESSKSENITQKVEASSSVSMDQNSATDSVQGMNIMTGEVEDSKQNAELKKLTMKARNNQRSIQGVNVVSSCKTCD
ncbi:MAG: hypothetical protein WGN25_16995 [Candidatus Electrothrix sp. GW3-4]|uniref:hypothetical protein n=1 Tax=Candidatus Electrothrix sp. GW3-4 TaxID=3126740 RepID=UPI0030D025D6